MLEPQPTKRVGTSESCQEMSSWGHMGGSKGSPYCRSHVIWGIRAPDCWKLQYLDLGHMKEDLPFYTSVQNEISAKTLKPLYLHIIIISFALLYIYIHMHTHVTAFWMHTHTDTYLHRRTRTEAI